MTTRRRTRPALRQHPDRQGREWGGRGALDDPHHDVEPVRSPVADVAQRRRSRPDNFEHLTPGNDGGHQDANTGCGLPPRRWSAWVGFGSGTATSAPDRRGRPPRCPARSAAAPTPIPMSSWNPPCLAALVNNDAIRSCASGPRGPRRVSRSHRPHAWDARAEAFSPPRTPAFSSTLTPYGTSNDTPSGASPSATTHPPPRTADSPNPGTAPRAGAPESHLDAWRFVGPSLPTPRAAPGSRWLGGNHSARHPVGESPRFFAASMSQLPESIRIV